MSAVDCLGQIYWSEWWERKVHAPADPEAVEMLKRAILFDYDAVLRADLVGNYCHHFFPRLPDTSEFLRSAAWAEADPRAKSEMERWAEHMDKMYESQPKP
jgi:hypothetical protein